MKKIIISLLVLSLVIVFASCGSSDEGTDAPAKTNAPEVTQAPSEETTEAASTTPAPIETTAPTPVTDTPVTGNEDELPEFEEGYTIDLIDDLGSSIYGFENHHEDLDYNYSFVFTCPNEALSNDIYFNEGIYKWTVKIVEGEGENAKTYEWGYDDITRFSYYPSDSDSPTYYRVDLGPDFSVVDVLPIPTYEVTICIYSEDLSTMEYYLHTVIEGFNQEVVDLSSFSAILPSSVSGISAPALTPWGDGAPENFYDGDKEGTKIGGAVSGGKLAVMFNADDVYEIAGYELTTGGDTKNYSSRNPNGWILYGSTDNENWVILDDQSETTLPAQNSLSLGFILSESASAKFFRIEFNTGDSFQLNEITVYYK